MIPKIIHYIWFGRGPKSELIQKCIHSWQLYMPEYKIIEWNEDNYILNFAYEKEAMEHKKYAFVSDVARLRIIAEYGGIYLDTDVELIRSLEPLLEQGGFLGFERKNSVNTGLGIAAPPGDETIKRLLAEYESIHFSTEDGIDQTACPVRNTQGLKKLGLIPNNTKQRIGNIIVYPNDYFCPLDYDSGKLRLTENTFAIHHYGYSWADQESLNVLALKRKIYSIFPSFCAQFVFNIVNKLRRMRKEHG